MAILHYFGTTKKNDYSSLFTPQGLVTIAVIVGLLARLFIFLSGRMLWQDEAMLAVNLATRSGEELFEPFTFTQIAPIGWILLTDWLHAISGDFEHVARLPGFIASCASLLIFPRLARQLFSGYTVSILVGLFALNGVLIDYTAQLKPYALDVLLSTAMLTLCLSVIHDNKISKQNMILLPITSLFGALFTFTAPFVLGGFGGILILKSLIERRWNIAVFLIPVLSFAGLIYIALGLGLYQVQASSAGFHSGYAANYFKDLYAPFPITGLGDITWYAWWGLSIFEFFAGFQSYFLWIFAGLAGIYLLARKSLWTLAILLTPLCLSILMSYPKIYPLLPRVNLYYFPIILILMGETLRLILLKREGLENTLVGSVLFLSLVAGSIWSLSYFSYFNLKEADSDLSAELQYLQENAPESEVILVDRDQVAGFLVYRKQFGLEKHLWAMTEVREDCKRAFAHTLKENSRFWLLRSADKSSENFQTHSTLIHSDAGILNEEIETISPLIDHVSMTVPEFTDEIPQSCNMPYRLSEEEMLGGTTPLWPTPDMWKAS